MTLNRTRIFAVMVSVLLMASVAVPGAVAGATESSGDLTLEVTQAHDTGEVLVTLSDNGTAPENATIDVTGDYVGNGTHDLDANGTITLPEPTKTTTVDITAETNDSRNVSGSFDLVPRAESLDIGVDQSGDDVVVTVTQYGDAVEGANVTAAAADENETYDGAGEYVTDANGTVSLVAPSQSLNVTLNASYDNLTAEETVQFDAANLSVSVSQLSDDSVLIEVFYQGDGVEGAAVDVSGDYTYAGDYTTDANGTVELGAPVNNTTIDVTAEYDNMTASTSANLVVSGDDNPNNDFAQMLVKYIEFIKMENISVPGQYISDFVHEHNPSSADDDAGKKGHGAQADDDSEQGPPDHAKNGKAKGHDKKQNGDDVDTQETDDKDSEDDDDDDEEEEEDGDEDDGNGPPDHANNDK